MGNGITEQDLPGIGHSYTITCADRARVMVVVHHTGRRDLYVWENEEETPAAAVTLSDDQARRLGAILAGEFSLILASLAATAGLDPRLGPFIAGYVLVLALAAPLLAANARALSHLIPERICYQEGNR
jgi:hypothetical protein